MAVNKSALVEFLKSRGFEIYDGMDGHIAIWKSWYAGAVSGFHDYKVWNGQKQIGQRRASLQLGKSVAEQWADLLFNEKCGIAIDDGSTVEAASEGVEGSNPTDQFVKLVLDQNNMYVKLNECQERKAAYGTVAIIPYYSGGRIRMSYVSADGMIPLSWEGGEITELCVYSPLTVNGKEYTYVQLFTVNAGQTKGTYVIENILLDEKAKKVDNLASIRGYEDVEERVETGSQRKPFVIDRLNIANNIDPDSPLGLSAFANSIDSLRMCDIIFDSYQNEFVLGKKRLMVATEAMNIESGLPVFDPNELVFYQLPQGVGEDDEPFIHELNMSIRAAEHRQSLQDALNSLSYQCGLGNGFFKYTESGVATATQVISENNSMFRTLKKHEIILESVIVDLIRLIIEMGIRHKLADGLNPDAKITVSFDDSIIEDKDKEIQRRMAEVAAGLLKPEEYIAWRYGLTIDKARAMMPNMPKGNNEEGMQ